VRFDPERHHRRSIRLPGYDYTRPGAYFVTLCIRGRECLLGDVRAGQMHLSECGRIVADCWQWLGERYPYVTLDAWVVMPNHLHGILTFKGVTDGRIEADSAKRKSLGSVIGAYKTVSTRHVNKIRGRSGLPLWQRDFYEHVVRREEDLRRIRAYILDNPRRWSVDQQNPRTMAGPEFET
jgi:putative transposase